MSEKILKKEDYEEPCCPLSAPGHVKSIPTGRVIDKLDEYLSRNDYASAERHLRYWLAEAECGNDMRGKLTVLNEQIGLYRKTGKREECFRTIDEAMTLVFALGMDNTVTLGTTLINAATGYKAFNEAEKAIPLYQKAQDVYESVLEPDDSRLGALYNNMALAYMETEKYESAEELFEKALSIMSKQPHGEGEMAITYLNLADCASQKLGLTESEDIVNEYLDTAEKLLDTPDLPRDGNHAFVCEKCAPTFGYYGFFMAEKKFAERAREIYERS